MMPEIGAILWAAIAGLILMMLAIIGYLIKSGFEEIKSLIKELFEHRNDHESRIVKIETRCEDRTGCNTTNGGNR